MWQEPAAFFVFVLTLRLTLFITTYAEILFAGVSGSYVYRE